MSYGNVKHRQARGYTNVLTQCLKVYLYIMQGEVNSLEFDKRQKVELKLKHFKRDIPLSLLICSEDVMHSALL